MKTNYLVCPIPPSSPSHYRHFKPKTLDDILDMLRNRKDPTHDENGFCLLDSAKPMYKRLFKKFGHSRQKKPQRRHVYAIFNLSLAPIAVYKTKAEALKMLERDVIPYTIYGRLLTPNKVIGVEKYNNVPVGSTVIRVPMIGKLTNIDFDRYMDPKKPEFYNFRVATKRCADCPRKSNPSALECGCSLINNIRDQVPGWTLQTEHQLLMKKHRDRKNEKVIKVSFNDLFE